MSRDSAKQAAIVDYGMGNLFSVRQACEFAGLRAEVTADRRVILDASIVILPGVGAFGKAMETLLRNDLVSVLRDVAQSGRPLVGICLGMQLLMTESHEFGRHQGLGLIEGDVVRLDALSGKQPLKVPHIGWSSVYADGAAVGSSVPAWQNSMLASTANGSFMYFVHSYYTRPQSNAITLSKTRFGDLEFCSTFSQGNIFACQFHPERSGPEGLEIYRILARMAHGRKEVTV